MERNNSQTYQMMHRAERKYQVGKVENEEEAKQRKLRAILNKLTTQNFNRLIEQIKLVNIDNSLALSGLVFQIYDRAVTEPIFCEMYANLCFHLSKELADLVVGDEKISFRRMLLNICQMEFEEGSVRQPINGGSRGRKLGNVRLIGELYKKRMLTERIIYVCVKKLLGLNGGDAPVPDEDDVEGLCRLMNVVGETIDHDKAKTMMDGYFDLMVKFSTDMRFSSRVRFLLLDTIDLRKNHWQQRRYFA